MLKMAMKLKARAADSEKKTAAAAAEVAAEAAAAAAALAEAREPLAPRKSGDPEKPAKNPTNPAREAPPEKFLTDKERRKLEKKLLEQRRKEEKKREKERKKVEKMLKKKKKVPEAQEEARGPEAAAAAAAAAAAEGAEEGAAGGAEGGAAAGGTSRAWAEWDTDSGDEDDAYYAAPRVGGVVWRPGPLKAGALSAHLPLVVFLVFSVRSPSWVLNFLLQKRTEQGRGCGFIFGATCCFRVFLGCAFFSYLGGRAKRRGRGRSGASGAFGSGHGARRRGREERLI
ncbi:uncharacterized protein LOC141585717 [Saimiri boliviensis]|uniref:uncharacterized protein LOC141585717 n=1 Tax=Saimiri boliviensis TaxID=27679 RepID=UPI003D781B43